MRDLSVAIAEINRDTKRRQEEAAAAVRRRIAAQETERARRLRIVLVWLLVGFSVGYAYRSAQVTVARDRDEFYRTVARTTAPSPLP
jgi:hypothetical protein